MYDYKRKNSPFYEHMREVGGIEYFEPIELARFNCTTKELREHEQTYIDKLSPKLNQVRAVRLVSRCEYNKAYYAANKDKFREYDRVRYAKRKARRASLQRIHHAALFAQTPDIRSATDGAIRAERPIVHSVEAS